MCGKRWVFATVLTSSIKAQCLPAAVRMKLSPMNRYAGFISANTSACKCAIATDETIPPTPHIATSCADATIATVDPAAAIVDVGIASRVGADADRQPVAGAARRIARSCHPADGRWRADQCAASRAWQYGR